MPGLVVLGAVHAVAGSMELQPAPIGAPHRPTSPTTPPLSTARHATHLHSCRRSLASCSTLLHHAAAAWPLPLQAYQHMLADVSIATGYTTIALMLAGRFVFQFLGW